MLSPESAEPLLAALQRSPLIAPRARLLVAVSGGPDSTALVVAARESGLDVVAAHYDHALRPGSEEVAGQVRALCDGLHIALITERRTEAMPRGSMQAGARDLRYAFLDRAADESGAAAVALAHTADDLVEGVVLHMLRGCGLAGFRGMPAARGRYVRPWLNVWRIEVVEFLRRRGIVAHADPANVDRKHARVRARLDILPALERDRPGILARFHAAAEQTSRLHDSAVAQASAVVEGGPPTASSLSALPEPVAMEILAVLYRRAGGAEPGLSRRQLDAMLRLARGGRGGRGVDLPRGLRFRIVGDSMQITRARSEIAAASARLQVRACAGCSDRDVAHLHEGLDLRLGYRTPGLRFRPAGGRGTRKLQDVFVDSLVPREDRDAWPLVFAGDRLAWVPGVAVDEDHASLPGRRALHVSVDPMPARFPAKVVRLETRKSPRGEST
ncbi:MAG TPA: tRNA lysidine(34) synthetase TilS [Candidatus Dormibacteraeota bacterium]|nr:tRNA lysidine(34) synthetase TilS [Candidatus Dormibacteraeota bacterium]